ncbi:hypothetical protein B0J13DRAFT_569518 [Dactylonectria estremocensis]|uniref:Uncharacterized protein n=1 Tax=Dactylonectria estremocensis TaxID=1079267 RepID=A0A9P9DGC4_9HYPO|nr:hypothetical protein B0J13DRAFT_569518 [Dactylonectria estremocensis]
MRSHGWSVGRAFVVLASLSLHASAQDAFTPVGTTTTTALLPWPDTTTTELPIGTPTTTTEQLLDTTTELPIGTPTTTTEQLLDTTTTAELPDTTTTTQGQPTTTTAQPVETTTTVNPADTTTDPGVTITDAPVLTTATGAAATSSVSSVSTEILALIPIINSWKVDPDNLLDETKNQVDQVKDHVIEVIKELGGDSNQGCDGKKRRGLLGAIGDIINSLVCIAQDLTDISVNIVNNDVTAVTSIISTIQTETEDLTDENDDNKTDEKSDQSSTEHESSTEEPTSTTTSPCTEDTAEHVTLICKPTTVTEDGNVVTSETCIESITVQVTGCSVTEATTIISTTGTAPAITPCASGTCGNADACPMGALPLSGADMNYVSSSADCGALSTVTTSELPTGYGALNDISIAEPTARAETDSATKKKRGVSARTFTSDTTPNPFYVASLNPAWVSQVGLVSGHWFNFPDAGQGFAGVNGIYGCTAVIIVSEKGVYLSHIWENPGFIDNNWNPTDDAFFDANVFGALRDGTADAQSITALVGDDDNPGVLNAIYSPKVFVLTPFTYVAGQVDPTGVTTEFRYQDRAQQLADSLVGILPGSSDSGRVLGYTRTDVDSSTEQVGTWGRAIVEVDALQSVLMSPFAPEGSIGLRIARWRLWVEDQLVTYQDFWAPDVSLDNQKREDSDVDVCLVVTSTGSTTEATSTATDSTTTEAIGTPTTDTVTTETTQTTETTAESTTETTETKTDPTATPTTFQTSTLTVTSAPDTTTSVPQTTITTVNTFTGPYPCVNHGGPNVATPYCQCSTTTEGQTFFATATLISGHCTDYTTFPSAVTLKPTEAPTTTQAAIPTSPLTRGAINCHLESDFPGHADINGGSQDDYSTEFSGLSGPNGDDNLYDGAGTVELSKSDKHGISYYYSVYWIDGCVTTQETQNFRFPLGIGSTITAYLNVREDYTKCDNGGVGGSVQVGCLLYTFTGGK